MELIFVKAWNFKRQKRNISIIFSVNVETIATKKVEKKVHWRQNKLVAASFIIVRCKSISFNFNKWSSKGIRTFNCTKPNRKKDSIIGQMGWHMYTNRRGFQNQNRMQSRIQRKARVSL